MSKIQKLSICGIRSFDHKSTMAIEFKAPLTLIVGMNGSGKTTIIECLKYVTTGELPPNCSNGQSFIHDPKMSGEKEVMAQVKLLFTGTDGARMVCSRSLSVTVKKDTRSFKTLEGSIRMQKSGERNVLSSRVIEMNAVLPRFLGVSKAILENVIFCHQENSLWPMLPPKDLKVIFDTIFEAHKYTKAIDNIKVLQKNKRQELAILKQGEDHAKSDNDKAKKLKQQEDRLDKECRALNEQSALFDKQIREAQREWEDIMQELGNVNLIVGELTGKRIERQTKEESVKILRENLVVIEESDATLQRMLDEHAQRIEIYQEELKVKRSEYSAKDDELTEARKQQSNRERECGSYEAEKSSNDRQIENRNRMIKDAARSHGMYGYDLVDDEKSKQFMREITKKAKDQQAEFERNRAEQLEKVQDQQKVLTSLNERISGARSSRTAYRQQIDSYDRKIGSVQSQKDNLPADEGSKVTLEAQLQEAQDKLKRARADLSNSDWNHQIEHASTEIRRLEELRDKLDAEQSEAAQRAGDSAQLDFVQQELKDRQRSLETMIKAHTSSLDAIVGHGWQSKTLEAAFQRAQDSSAAQVKDAQSKRDESVRRYETISASFGERNDSLRKKQEELKTSEREVMRLAECKPHDYPSTIQQLEEERDNLKKDADSFGRVQEYLQQCINDAKKGHCRTCTRSVQDDELQVLLDSIKAQQQRYQGSAANQDTLKECTEVLDEAKKAGIHVDTWERLTHKEIPALKEEVRKLEKSRSELKDQVEAENAEVRDSESAQRDIGTHKKTVEKISSLAQQIEAFQRQISELSAKQKSAGLSRGLEAIQADIKEADAERKRHAAAQSEATGQRDRKKSSISALELEISNVTGQLQQAEYNLKQKKALDDQEQEYKSLRTDAQKNVRQIDGQLATYTAELDQEQEKYTDITRRGDEKDREQQEKANRLNNTVNKLNVVILDIRAYEDRGGDGQLTRAREAQAAAEADVTRIQAEQRDMAKDINKLQEHSHNYAEMKRSISDNQRFRRDRAQLEAVQAEIDKLEARGAEADAGRLENKAKKWEQTRNELAAEQASVMGELKGLDRELKEANELYQSEYVEAGKKYQTAHILVETTKAAINDLGLYWGALDKAIMKFHTLKMEEINRIIDELWRSTYQGSDVDTVAIRSEGVDGTTRGNKSYNYRVVMVKQDTEMDMRGRCSAGQKVLASIIIRLALADVFGKNCGMIALDEPTTNLDSNNIIALAQSLSLIIKLRRKQANFQLIVITHDETFLNQMNCSDYTDDYWRISRDEDQHTVIEKQNISAVMG
ncbi:putative DNA repair protein Rad50 [Septoria linicola]|nr:putative DNA repair protein Rad50 [Septoria linicola]